MVGDVGCYGIKRLYDEWHGHPLLMRESLSPLGKSNGQQVQVHKPLDPHRVAFIGVPE